LIKRKKKKLSHEILLSLLIAFLISFVLGAVLIFLSVHIAEESIFSGEVFLDDLEYSLLVNRIYNTGMLVSVIFFLLLFLFFLSKKLSYIKNITDGINALHGGRAAEPVAIIGNNELSSLAEAVNLLSETEKQIKAEEKALAEEKELFIRSLSHDIRTPLTAIMAYSEISLKEGCSESECREHMKLIRNKAEQIKELTDVLLDGGSRKLEHFKDARLLFAQLCEDFEEELEASFELKIETESKSFEGTFDVAEMRRIFDNIISNVRKYADPCYPIELVISYSEGSLAIRQSNVILSENGSTESYGMGIKSMKRIAQNYKGRAESLSKDGIFTLNVILNEI